MCSTLGLLKNGQPQGPIRAYDVGGTAAAPSATPAATLTCCYLSKGVHLWWHPAATANRPGSLPASFI